MTKNELIRKVAQESGTTQVDAEANIDAFIKIIKESLISDTSIQIRSLGKFSLGMRKARKGYNPISGESIDIPAMRVARFKPSSEIKRAVKNVGL